MHEQVTRSLVHAVNNLLAVVFTQAEVARDAADPGAAARRALELIERAARDTEVAAREAVRSLRAAES